LAIALRSDNKTEYINELMNLDSSVQSELEGVVGLCLESFGKLIATS
jgi:hypothetical protein